MRVTPPPRVEGTASSKPSPSEPSPLKQERNAADGGGDGGGDGGSGVPWKAHDTPPPLGGECRAGGVAPQAAAPQVAASPQAVVSRGAKGHGPSPNPKAKRKRDRDDSGSQFARDLITSFGELLHQPAAVVERMRPLGPDPAAQATLTLTLIPTLTLTLTRPLPR